MPRASWNEIETRAAAFATRWSGSLADLDRVVDLLYRKAPFDSDADRVAMLFERYQMLTKA